MEVLNILLIEYQSSWIWAGFTKGLAGIQLSGSVNKYVSINVNNIIMAVDHHCA